MPIYVYRCKLCGHTTEKVYNKSEVNTERVCATCGSRELDKLGTSFFNASLGIMGPYRFN